MPYLTQLKDKLGSARTVTKHLNGLHRNAMETLMYEMEAELFWGRRNHRFTSYDQKDRALMGKVLRKIKKRLVSGRVPPERTVTGAPIERGHTVIDSPVAYERIMLNGDFKCLQIDAYSGHWFNPQTMELVEYCEGDVFHIRCESRDQYQNEYSRALTFVMKQVA